MSYKVLALDMDGTLLNSRKEITRPTAEAIERLLERGVHVVFSSGRNLPEMLAVRRVLKNVRYGIQMSGGLVYDYVEDKVIAVHPVTVEDIIDIINVGLDERAMIHLHTVRDSIACQLDIDHMSDFHMGIYRTMFDEICMKVDDIKGYALEHKDTIVKVNLYHRSAESRERSVERLKHRDLEMVFAEETSLEASPRGVSKASGLIELCEYLGVDLEQTIAVGDAPNDLEILQTAGVGVAMGNATDEIKALADFITLDNDHDGIVAVIEKYF